MVSLRDFDLPEFPWSLAVDSARGISYTPERHASADREVYYELLQKILGKLSPVFDKNQIAAVLKDFAEKYLSRLRDVYSTKRYIVSPMISGPSGFPVARMKKLNERLEKKERALDEFVEKYMRRVDRMVSQKNIELAGGEEEVTKAKLEEMKELLEGMKEVNKMIRKGALRSAIEEKMRELGFDESKIKGVLEPDYMGRVGFQDFDLRSVRDKIKRLERKLETLAEKKTHEPVEIEEKTEDYKIVRNYNLDRVMIFFSEIPPVELREKLKRNGWHWSPKNKAWMRKLTESAVYDAKRILNDFFGEKQKQPTFDVIGALTRSFPEWRELVADSYFAAKPQQRSLMEKWAKEGYELFDWSTGVGRERSVAETEAKRKGFDPFDIHEINIANYTLWFGKKGSAEEEPWRMTSREYFERCKERIINRLRSQGKNVIADRLDKMTYEVAKSLSPFRRESNSVARCLDSHERLVERALGEGKPVPEEVLREYPSLVEMYPKKKEEKKIELGTWGKILIPKMGGKVEKIRDQILMGTKIGVYVSDVDTVKKFADEIINLYENYYTTKKPGWLKEFVSSKADLEPIFYEAKRYIDMITGSKKEQPTELVPEVVKKKQKVLEEVPPEERQKMEIEKRHRELKKKEEKERRKFLEDVSKGKKKPVESLDSWIGQTTLDKFVGVILLLGAGVIAFRFVEDTVSRYR